jgi:hypothetical protein
MDGQSQAARVPHLPSLLTALSIKYRPKSIGRELNRQVPNSRSSNLRHL